MYILLVTRTVGTTTFTFVLDVFLSKKKAEKIRDQHQASMPTDICWLDGGGDLPRYFYLIEEALLWLDEHKANFLKWIKQRKS